MYIYTPTLFKRRASGVAAFFVGDRNSLIHAKSGRSLTVKIV
ncbi:hypothetical protein [Pseudanabaena sp. PCC 6802]|nr:hypothetical protein [Pseudanabaena sp. PCC 6802]